MAAPTEWVRHLCVFCQNSSIMVLGRISRLNRILHRYPQFRHRPIAGRPAEERPPCILDRKMIFLLRFEKSETELKKKCSELHVVYFPTIWNRFFNISKRFSKKCSAHLELVCKVIRTYFQMLSRILNSFSKK